MLIRWKDIVGNDIQFSHEQNKYLKLRTYIK